jgi:hypothetical protein
MHATRDTSDFIFPQPGRRARDAQRSAATFGPMIIDRIRNYFSRDESNLPLVIAAVVLSITFLLLFIVGHNDSEAEQKLAELEREFRAVAPLPQAAAHRYSAYSKPKHALVIGTYKTNLSYPEIKAHYDDQLSKQGWVFYEGDQDWVRGRGNTAEYCKGEYRAVIDTQGGKRATGGITFSA